MKIKNKKSYNLKILSVAVIVSGLLIGCDKKQIDDNNITEVSSKVLENKQEIKPTQVEKKIAATVNGKPIYDDELKVMVEKKLKKDSRYMSSGLSPEQISIVRANTLKTLIDKEVLLQASLKEPVKNIDELIKQEIAVIVKKFGSVEKFKNYMPSKKMTDAEFDTYLNNKIHVREYLKKQGVIDPAIPEEDIKKFYDNGKKNFRSEELVKVSHILLALKPDATKSQKDEILKKANRLRDMIINGEDFAKIAKEYSQSADGNRTGGEIGMIKKGFMPKEFDEVAFSLKKDEISKPILTKFGYHIIKVTDRQEAKTASYEKSRDFIKKFLQERVTIKALDELKQKLREKAKIEIMQD